MVVAYHLGGRLGMECGCRWSGGFLAQSEMGGISGFFLSHRIVSSNIELYAP